MVIHDLYPEKSKVILLIHPILASSESMRRYFVENILKVTDDIGILYRICQDMVRR